MISRVCLVILNFIFYIGIFLFSIVIIIVGVILFSLAFLIFSKRTILRRFRRTISWYGKIVVYVLPFPFVKIVYKDFWKKKETGPFIFICNHRSAVDPFLFAFLPYECIQVVNIWPFKLPFFGFFAKRAGYLSVKELSHEDFSKEVSKLLEEGVNIISFPEGTRATHKKLGQFYSSIFRVAYETQCSIVPVCFTGNEKVMAKGTSILRPGVIKIHKLPPLHWNDYKDLTPFTLKKKVRGIIEKETVRMDAL
ncbi:hypothetical protein MNBD_UNCLBAC01-995 [hydrothermal vent metagenome]|uniref:Phospholipid/glycerol acyltransferase domain-containing protein n=1 Tax=hydrothermal vent metagenome TaxID=652676 RepID=A0A3B1DH51_9ZZZZ